MNSLEGTKSRKSIRNKIAKMVNIETAKIVIIGNPPYVEVKLDDFQEYDFDTLKCRNLSAYFLEQALGNSPETWRYFTSGSNITYSFQKNDLC